MLFNGFLRFSMVLYNLLTDLLTDLVAELVADLVTDLVTDSVTDLVIDLVADLMIYMDLQYFSMVFYAFQWFCTICCQIW